MNLEINPLDKKAVELLKEFREKIDRIIYCTEQGDQYGPCAININKLLEARDYLAMARAID